MSCDKLTKKYQYYKKIRKQKKLFGTFGFRGIFNHDITIDKIERLGCALALYIGKGKRIAIGKDPRISSDILEDALIKGIIDNGCDVITLGIVTPNALSLEVNRQADIGIMITASHNPPEYNGVKCLTNIGRGFSPEEDLELERIYFGESDCKIFSYSDIKKGKRLVDSGINDRYCNYLYSYIKNMFPSTSGMKIVVDGGGGSASRVTPEILKRLGHEVVEFNCRYDGMFTVRDPEPTSVNLDKLKKLVNIKNADLGIAHDGDGDRTSFIDEKGRFIQGDISASIIADYILRNNNDKEKKIAVTIAFSRIIEHISKNIDTEIIYTPVGEPYLAQAKLLCNAQLGLEEHGSVMLEWSREGPMLAGLMSGILNKEEITLSELVALYPKYYQVKDAIIIPDSMEMDTLFNRLMEEIPHDYKRVTDMDGIRVDYSDKWFILRPSGTESKIRVFSEGSTEKIAKRLNRMVMDRIEKAIPD